MSSAQPGKRWRRPPPVLIRAVQVDTVGGSTVEVNVPVGSGSGRKLRLKGRGIPAAQLGDLYSVLLQTYLSLQ